MPLNDTEEPKTILTSVSWVTKALREIARETHEEYRELILEKMHETGGEVTTDGVTLKVQDKQFQDLTVHFIEVAGTNRLETEPNVEMKEATLLLKEKPEIGDAATIRSMLSRYLQTHYGKEIPSLTKRFTMVTDCAAVMARVAFSSISPNVAPMDEKWMGCLAHQLNTAMKCCVEALSENENAELEKISTDLQSVKNFVRIFKQSGWNALLPNGYHLIQECETRFETALDVARRFVKSVSEVKGIVERKNSSPAKEAFSDLLTERSRNGRTRIPALEAIADAFEIVVETQTKIQSESTPTVHIALPPLQSCSDELERIADGGSIGGNMKKNMFRLVVTLASCVDVCWIGLKPR